MKNKLIENVPYILLVVGLLIIIGWATYLFNTNSGVDIETQRETNLNNYSAKAKVIDNLIEEHKTILKNLRLQQKAVQECLTANSTPGIVTDCDLYFKNKKGKQ